jgi:RNA polymerase sigma-70 factor (ECF subfamily)
MELQVGPVSLANTGAKSQKLEFRSNDPYEAAEDRSDCAIKIFQREAVIPSTAPRKARFPLNTFDPKLERTALFEQLYETYADYITHYLSGYCASWQDAEDLTQEVFLKAFLHLHQLRDPSNAGSWLRQIAHNTYVSSLRKKSVSTTCLSDNVSWLSDHEASFSLVESLDALQDTVGADSPEYTIIMCAYAGYSYGEIAAMLGISPQAVRNRLCRIRKKIRADQWSA